MRTFVLDGMERAADIEKGDVDSPEHDTGSRPGRKFIRTNGFRDDLAQYSRSIVVKLPFATNSTIELARFAEEGLRAIFKEGYAYKKAGVVLMDFCSEDEIQQNLFTSEHPKHKILMKAIDSINSTSGRQVVKLASQDKDRIWKMKQEKLSPRYTTKLGEVISVKS